MNSILNRIKEDLKEKNKHGIRRILLVGTGGGSDIFSSLLIAKILEEELKKPRVEIDLAGMLSPASIHEYTTRTFYSSIENPVNEFNRDTTIKRVLPDGKEISFVDNVLWKAIDSMRLRISKTIHLSCRYGTQRLQNAFDDWCRGRQYDMVIGVDVGGDILGNVLSNSILSPLMDWTSLKIIHEGIIKPSYILEFGFGLDGESNGSIPLDYILSGVFGNIKSRTRNINHFAKMFESIVKPTRSGHTIPNFLSHVFDPPKLNSKYTYEHSYNYKIAGFTDTFSVTVDHHPKETFLFDTSDIIKDSYKLVRCLDYHSPLDFAIRLKNVNPHISTEMDGHLVVTKSGLAVNALISDRIECANRDKMIANLCKFADENGYGVLIFKKDFSRIDILRNGAYTRLIQSICENIFFVDITNSAKLELAQLSLDKSQFGMPFKAINQDDENKIAFAFNPKGIRKCKKIK